MIFSGKEIEMIEYKEDWSQHNFIESENNNDAKIKEEFMSNCDLDTTLFDEEQLDYLTEFLNDYRIDICKHLVSFICKSNLRGVNQKNIDALFVRIAGRAALLDDILNNRNTKVTLWKTTYGTSIHQRYDAVAEMIEELKEFNPFIDKVLAKR